MDTTQRVEDDTVTGLRQRLRADTMITERRIEAAGIDTMLLEGGQGPGLVLLHGPGAFAEAWLDVLPALAETHHVIAPDLPGHGVSAGAADLGPDRVFGWLASLIEQTCTEPPVLIGHALGGAIAARFAVEHGDRISRLLLVDTMGLAPFEPAPLFGAALHRYFGAPSEATYNGLMQYCSFDAEAARRRLGDRWTMIADYAVDRAQAGSFATTGLLMEEFGAKTPELTLARITVPTELIWGRHDLAIPLRIAQSAARVFGWPLHIIEDCADEPSLDQPEALVAVVRSILAGDAR